MLGRWFAEYRNNFIDSRWMGAIRRRDLASGCLPFPLWSAYVFSQLQHDYERSPMRPFRSVLYMPGSNSRALEKARSLPADALILDLEDAVAPDAKAEGRARIAEAVNAGGYGGRYLIVRINGFDTEWGADDIAGIAACRPDAVLLPKVNRAENIHDLLSAMDAHETLSSARVWAMMETPEGVLNAAAIAAASPRLEGFVMGTNDLVKELHARHVPDRGPVQTALSLCLLAARQRGLICVDGVYNDIRDNDGLIAECNQGRAMGFDGKTLIHPGQLAAANAAFGPTSAEIEEAHAFVAAFDAALAEGRAVAVVNGRIVENLHVENARRLIAQAEAIEAMASDEG